MVDIVRYTGSGDLSALYVDGLLAKVGDHYQVDAELTEILRVTEVRSDDFLMGGRWRSNAATTLCEVTDYCTSKESKLAAAQRLRAEADRLTAEAHKLTS